MPPIAIENLELKVMPKPYDDFEISPFAGLPSASLDAAWHHLLEPTTIRVSAEELQQANQSSVTLPNGGYMAWLGVFHELHCIVSDSSCQKLWTDTFTLENGPPMGVSRLLPPQFNEC